MSSTSLSPGEHLAKRRNECGFSQDELARTLDVSRTVISQWENGHRRPRPVHLAALAEALDDDGTLARLFADSDGTERVRLFDTPTTVTVLVRRTVDRLLEHLSSDPAVDGGPGYGWPYDLDNPDAGPSALSTAYGLTAVLLTGAHDWRVNLPRVREMLHRLELSDGGWSVSTSVEALPEVTAVIVAALHDAGEDDDYVVPRVSLVLDALRREVQGAVPARPYVLATSLLELSRLPVIAEDGAKVRKLIDDLVDLSLDDPTFRTWPLRVKKSGLAPIIPSPVHTAIAVCALAAWARRLDDARIRDVALSGAAWLEQSRNLGLEVETLSRHGDDGRPGMNVSVREFTPAWVVRALISMDRDAESSSVTRALHEMFTYHLPDVGLWHWPRDGGLVPVWMTYNAVAALMAWAGAHQIG
jgi:transcriptional regulator with XRE-family HTH domain